MLHGLCAVAAFHLAYELPHGAPLMAVFLWNALQLARRPSARTTLYSG